MKSITKWIVIGLIVGSLFSGALAADAITGDWTGSASVSGFPIGFSVTVSFSNNDTFTLKTLGLTVTGQYALDGKTLTVTPKKISGTLAGLFKKPGDIGRVKTSVTMKDDAMTIAANTQGMKANVTLKRKK